MQTISLEYNQSEFTISEVFSLFVNKKYIALLNKRNHRKIIVVIMCMLLHLLIFLPLSLWHWINMLSRLNGRWKRPVMRDWAQKRSQQHPKSVGWIKGLSEKWEYWLGTGWFLSLSFIAQLLMQCYMYCVQFLLYRASGSF